MLLKSLELQGFKTFPDKTKLNFNEGITSVVGPNGSGKSNISDAIRWVLGEQSTKSLRCSRMEDVVFGGTTSRKQQGFAEVTLTIDNTDRALMFDGDTVSVTRRYYRSGESEYLINKAQVRLKDINELFMDTGLGRDGYSMIGQGKIDSIVSSKSEDRREIFEEAAGISRYRYRKTEAERKLAHTEDNLVRLRDIVTELEARIGPLKAQAKKAESFLEYSEEKRGLEIALWLDSLNKSSGVIKDHEDKIAISEQQLSDADKVLFEITQRTEELYNEGGRISVLLEQLRATISAFESEISQKRSDVSVYNNDILHNNESIERINAQIKEIEDFSVDIVREIENKSALIEETKKTIEKKQREYESLADTLNNINIDASRSSDVLQEITARIAALSAKQADSRVTLMTSTSSISDLEGRVTSLNDNKSKREQQLGTLSEMLTGYQSDIESTRKLTVSLSNSIKGIELKLQSKSSRLKELREKADRLTLDSMEKARRAKVLSDLEQNMDGFSSSVKTVMQASKSGVLKGIRGPVSRIITVSSEYTVAVETALGYATQNIVTVSEEDAKRAIAYLKQQKAGRATFLPVGNIKGKKLSESGLDDCYGFVGIASDLCSCDPQYDNILLSLLGRIAVFEDLNCAAAAAKKYGYRFKAVTLDGQIVNAGGSLTGGSFQKNSGLLSRTAEIAKIKKEADELMKNAEAAKAEYSVAESENSAIEASLLGYRGDLSTASQELVRLETEEKACLNELTATKEALDEISNEISECSDKIDKLNEDKEKAELVIADFSEKISSEEARAQEISGSRLELKEKREELSAKLQELRLLIVTLEKDVENIESDIESIKISGDNQNLRKAEYLAETETLAARNTDIEAGIARINAEIDELISKISASQQDIEDNNSKKDMIERENIRLRQLEKDKMSERELISSELARLNERKNNLKIQFDSIISKLWEEYELTRLEAESHAVEIENISEAQRRLSELKQKIKNLGSVNVAAIEEYKEVSERYDFLSVQVADVEKSKKEILSLIGDLTKKMKESFVESFALINKNFGITFTELFGGGSAKLVLSDADDLLNSGIDISVHPPGKIVAHLDALSGGEKALVAIALYFAIMKVRPAPFCVMDEIEAALDEVNVDRFARYLRNLTASTQFITITHRRGTMEESDVLYGVTMQEEGISKLLELRASEVAEKLKLNAN